MIMRRGFAQSDAEAVVSEAYLAVVKTWQQRRSLVEPHRLFAMVRQRLTDAFRRRDGKPVSLVESNEGIAETANILSTASPGPAKGAPRRRDVAEVFDHYDGLKEIRWLRFIAWGRLGG